MLPNKKTIEFAVATIIGDLDFWGHQEVMIKCVEQSMKRIAELLRERRSRRAIVKYSLKGCHQSNGVVENAHYHLEGVLRTMRSDLMQKTGVNVNVKSLLAPCMVRHCAWSLTRFASGADGQTAFKRQRGKDYVGETACFGEAICHRIPLRTQTKMEPRWEADGVFLGKLDLSDEVIVGIPKGTETTRSFRRMTEDRQWNPETLRMFVAVPWNPRGISNDAPGGTRKRHITRALVQTHGATDGCPACQGDGPVHVPRCQNRLEDIFDQERNSQVNHVRWYSKTGQVMRLNKSCQVFSVCKWSKNRNNNMHQSQSTVHSPSSSSHEEPMQGSTTPRRARNPGDESEMRTVRPRLDMSALINELCERDVPEIDWEKLALDSSSVYDIYTGVKLDEEQVRAGRETEVKRMLEFEMYEEVNEEQVRGKRIWTVLGWIHRRDQDWWSIKSEVQASAKTCLRPHHHLQHAFHFVPCCIAWSWPLPRLVGCVGSILPRSD